MRHWLPRWMLLYYGNVTKTKAKVKNLNAPVLEDFSTKDKQINQAMINGCAKAVQGAGKMSLLQAHWYDTHHPFAPHRGPPRCPIRCPGMKSARLRF